VEVVAKRENGEIRKISKQVLKKYDLDPEKVEDMKKLLDEQADGKDWTLEIVETNGVIMFQGKLAEDEDWGDDSASEKSPQDAAFRDEPPTGHKLKQESEPAEERKPARQPEDSEGEGSEEIFKDEL
jgi:protein OS-9